MRKNKKSILTLTVLVFTINFASASYLAGDIYLKENGNVQFEIDTDQKIAFSGLTFENNHISGTTNELLTLKGGVWTLNISLPEYEDIFLEIHLPKNLVSIQYVEGSDNIIDIEKKTITIADSGKLDFRVSYILREQKNYSWAYWTLAIILLSIGFFVYKKATKKRERLQSILPIINEKEQQIVDLLMKKPARQKELRKTLNLPKASFSRYMVNLERKKLILREGEGKNKLVRLK